MFILTINETKENSNRDQYARKIDLGGCFASLVTSCATAAYMYAGQTDRMNME